MNHTNNLAFNTELSKNIFSAKYMLPSDTTIRDAINRVLTVVGKYYPEVVEELDEAICRQWVGVAGGLWRSACNPNNVSAINCTTLAQPTDDLESIADMWYWWAKFSAYGQGEGVDLSKLRPRGSSVHNSANTSTGAVSFMRTLDGILSVIAQQGRRGASLISLNISHPDIPEFITVKDEEGVLETANISIHITDDFMNTVATNQEWEMSYTNKYETVSKKMSAVKLFHMIAEHAWKSGDPGLQFIDTARKQSNSDYLGTPIVSTNACSFVGSTLITTREGVYPIQDLVNKLVRIFDGTNWVENNTFEVTGCDQPIYRVTLSSGVWFDVTDQHRFFTENREVKRTNELLVNDTLEYNLENAIYYGQHREDGAYLKGFLLGDGNIHDLGHKTGAKPVLWLYAPKYMCFDKIKESLYEIEVTNTYKTTNTECIMQEFKSSGNKRANITGLVARERNSLYKWASEYKHNLPNDVFNWDKRSKTELIAGLFDADGTAMNSSKGFGYQLTSVHKEFLIGVLRLLSTMGVYGKLSAGNKGGIRKIRGDSFMSNPTWRITVPQVYAIKMSKLISFERLTAFKDRTVSRTPSFRYNRVAGIEKLEGKADKVYCTHVASTSKFMVNSGIITGNSEQYLDAHNVCILSSINLAKYHEYGETKYKRLVHMMIRVLDAFRLEEIAMDRSPSPIQMGKLVSMPRIGLGVTGLADYFIQNKIVYASETAIDHCHTLFGILAGESYKASYEIAKTNGKSFPLYDKQKYLQSPFVQSLLTKGLIEDRHLDFQAHVCKTTIAPNGTVTEVVEAGGGGIEPIFAKYYTRRERATTNEWKEWYVFNHAVREMLDTCGLELTKENADKITADAWWATAHDVNSIDKIQMMSVIQQYIDSAISITYNLPASATIEDVEEVYMSAWLNKLKAVAVYRDGSKTGVFLTTTTNERHAVKRPKDLPCDIYTIQVQKQRLVALVGLYENSPYEIFITDDPTKQLKLGNHQKGIIHKKRSGVYNLVLDDTTVITDISKVFNHNYGALGRMVSMSLRHNVPLQFVIEQLDKTPLFGTFSKGVARVLKKYLSSEKLVVQREVVCADCGGEMVFEGGCSKCLQCGSSKCD